MIQLTDEFCVLLRYRRASIFWLWMILLYVIQLSGGHCTFSKNVASISAYSINKLIFFPIVINESYINLLNICLTFILLYNIQKPNLNHKNKKKTKLFSFLICYDSLCFMNVNFSSPFPVQNQIRGSILWNF